MSAIGGHHSPQPASYDWLTPPFVLEALGPFDCDPACPPDMPWRTAAVMFTPREDGLAQDWRGVTWLNPPYGQEDVQGPWLRRLVAHGNGFALVFARTETKLFFECVWRSATALLFLEGRLHFHFGAPWTGKAGRRYAIGERAPHNGGAPSVVIAYGKACAARLLACELAGRYVLLAEAAP